MANTRCSTSQLYGLIRTWKRYSNSTTQAADLAFQTVGVAGFEPTASSSRSNNNSALTSAFPRVWPVQPSLRIHGGPWSSVVIVTQFVTHPHTRRS